MSVPYFCPKSVLVKMIIFYVNSGHKTRFLTEDHVSGCHYVLAIDVWVAKVQVERFLLIERILSQTSAIHC